MSRQPTCPTCERAIEWTEEFPYRPFCSERCRLIDLGAWLTEEHRIAGEPLEDSPQGPGQTDDDPDNNPDAQ